MSRAHRLLIAVVVVAAVAPSAGHAARARLDTNFGRDGIAPRARIGPSTEAWGATSSSDGTVLAFGQGSFSGGRAVVVRYAPNGSLDRSLAGRGITSVRVGDFIPTASGMSPDGAVLLAGYRTLPGDDYLFPDWEFILVKLTKRGALDLSFGSSGVLVFDEAPSIHLHPQVITFQPDGKILFAYKQPALLKVARLMSDGSLDRTFGVAGTFESRLVGIAQPFSNFGAGAMQLLPDGKILIGGTYEKLETAAGPGEKGLYLARLLANGSPDPIFGDAGVRSFPMRDYVNVWVVRRMKDDRILTAGSERRDATLTMTRHLPDGSLDPSFDSDGIAWAYRHGRRLSDIAIDGRGAVFVTFLTGRNELRATLVRYANGRVDQSFAKGGALSLTGWLEPEPTMLLPTPKGLVVVGSRVVNRTWGISAIRLLS